MKRKIFLIITLFLLIVQSYAAYGQFTPAEIAQREELEEFLRTAEIVEYDEMREGVTKPLKVLLKKGEVERYAVWKNPRGIQKGFLEGWQYEIAAYQMDKLLGLNLVPPTVERKLKGKRGSLQLWIEHEYSLLEIMEQKIPIPRPHTPQFEHFVKMNYLNIAFDSLIANDDRTQQNIRYTKDWRLILIDHSRSFRSSKKFTEQLLYGKHGMRSPELLFRRLPRAFVEKVKALNFDSIKKAVGPHLTDREIKAILIRKELLLVEIEQMIKEYGEDDVLY